MFGWLKNRIFPEPVKKKRVYRKKFVQPPGASNTVPTVNPNAAQAVDPVVFNTVMQHETKHHESHTPNHHESPSHHQHDSGSNHHDTHSHSDHSHHDHSSSMDHSSSFDHGGSFDSGGHH